MPFACKKKILDLDRSVKLNFAEVHKKMARCIDDFFVNPKKSKRELKHYFQLLPVLKWTAPCYANPDPNNYLVLYAQTKGISLPEIELWLDAVDKDPSKVDSQMKYVITQTTGPLTNHMDYKKMYFLSSLNNLPKNHLLYKSLIF